MNSSTLFSEKNHQRAVNVLLMAASACLLLCAGWMLSRASLPAEEDETIYYGVAEFFAAHSSVKAPSFIRDEVSPLTESNWYGPFYSILYGSATKVLGLHGWVFIVLNFLWLGLGLWVISRWPMSGAQKRNIVALLLLCNLVFCYSFTYYPELFNILLGLILTGLLFRMSGAKSEAESRRFLFMYVGLCVAFCLVRATWAFWLLGILPFAASRKDLALRVFAIVAGIGLAFIYTKYFCAPAFAAIGKVGGAEGAGLLDTFSSMLSRFASNAGKLLFSMNTFGYRAPLLWNITKYFTLLAMLHFLISGIRRGNKLSLAVFCISGGTYAALLTLYTPDYPFFMKITGSVAVLNIAAAVYLNQEWLRWFYLAGLTACFPLVLYTTKNMVQSHHLAAQDAGGSQAAAIAELKGFTEKIKTSESLVTVQVMPEGFADVMAVTPLSTHLPVKAGDCAIRYSIVFHDSTLSEAQQYPKYEKLKTDYILSRRALKSRNDLTLLDSNNIYYFYKISAE